MPEQEAGQVAAEKPWTAEVVETETQKLEQQQPDANTEAEGEDAPPDARPEKLVKLQALDKERAKAREFRAQNQVLSQQLAELNRQVQEMRQSSQPKVEAPDPTIDPTGAILYNQQKQNERLETLAQQQHRQQAEGVQRQQLEQFVGAVRSANVEFAKETPDANDGINHLKQNRIAEYLAMGMGQQEAQQRLQKDEWDLASWALQNGENPARVAYNMAVARGYVPGKTKLEMQNSGQRASLPSSGAGKSGGMPSLDTLLKMDKSDFSKATSGDNWEKLAKKYL